MFKKILAATAMLFAIASFAAVDVNKGTAADLDGIKGVGPSMSKRILDARKEGEFKDWPDLDRKSTRLNSSHYSRSRMPSSA